MRKITMESPVVSSCAAVGCAYNINRSCHARAITVGDAVRPDCDTYAEAMPRTHAASRVAGVGACKAAACRFNEDLECVADAIDVGFHQGRFQCRTYQPR